MKTNMNQSHLVPDITEEEQLPPRKRARTSSFSFQETARDEESDSRSHDIVSIRRRILGQLCKAGIVSDDESDEDDDIECRKSISSRREKQDDIIHAHKPRVTDKSLPNDENAFFIGQPLPSPPRLPNVPAGYAFESGVLSAGEESSAWGK